MAVICAEHSCICTMLLKSATSGQIEKRVKYNKCIIIIIIIIKLRCLLVI